MTSIALGGSERTEERQHIIVVDDDPLILSYLEVLLNSLDYVVTAASDGEAALRLLATEQDFDLMFTDIRLGGALNGGQLARLAQDLRPDLGVLFTSASVDALVEKIKKLPQFRGFVRKPYRKQQLADALRLALAPQDLPVQPSSS